MSMLIERHKHINPNAIPEPMEVRIATESYKNNNDMIGQFITDCILVVDDPDERMNISTLYSDFRSWAHDNIPKSKKRPDRNQLKAYFEKLHGAYPIDTKGWKGLKKKTFIPDEDEEISE